ncbi:MAG: aldehyde dehydrogenase family protein, partial [Bacteroidales bacterium]|nr:aldehyde dehydrogenase family protein [Bacteroidales bacterium]
MAYTSFDPFRQQVTNEWDADTDSTLRSKIGQTYLVWKEWRHTKPAARTALLENLASVLQKKKESFAAIIVSEMGKPVTQAVAEVEKCAMLCRYYATNLDLFLSRAFRVSQSLNSYVRLDPQGIIMGIMPWNYPFWQVFRFLVPVLAGGNGAVLKHASNVTGCANAIESALIEAGFPDSIFRVLLPSHDQMPGLISLPEIRGVALTGSNEAGSVIGSLAGKYFKKSVLELGGSDPFIVFNDADIPRAVTGAVTGRFQNCGQSCIAAKRIIVHESVYDTFLESFVSQVRSLKSGNPVDGEVFIGPLTSSSAAAEVDRQVKGTASMGGKIVAGGSPGNNGPAFYEPTVITDIPAGSPMVTEEVFGPVAPVFRFATTEEGVSIANRTRFGLGASVWTNDRKLASRIAEQLDTGTVAINGFVRSDP